MNARAARRASNKLARAPRRSRAHPPSQEELQRQVERQQREIDKLREQVAERDRQIADAEKQIADLERQLAARNKNSTNSSKPPSSDGLAGAQRRRCSARKKSGRKPGGQPGHMGQERQPVETPDRTEEILPLQCKHCGTALPQTPEERQATGEVFCRQIVDLPEVILPLVTKYQYPKLVCPCCQKGTRAELRSEHAHEIGERLTAAISYLIVVRKMTRRDVQATLQEFFSVDISLGSVQKAWEEMAEAVAAPYRELEEALPTEPVLNGDETGSRTNGDKRWVWVLCSSWFVFYHIACSRGVAVLVELLGKAFAGILRVGAGAQVGYDPAHSPFRDIDQTQEITLYSGYYRAKAEEEQWQAERDPIALLAARLGEDLDAVRERVAAEVDDAVQYALNAPFPDPSEVTKHVHA